MIPQCTHCHKSITQFHATERSGECQLLCDRCYDLLNEKYLPICDFCSKPEVFAWYPTETFDATTQDMREAKVTMDSVGDWAACAYCHSLIQREDWHRLTLHAAKRFAKRNPDVRGVKDLYALLLPFHTKFREHRTHKFMLVNPPVREKR